MSYQVLRTKQNDYELITFSITAQKLLELVHFKSRFDDPVEGVQRAYNITKSRKIADAIIDGDLSIPNSIIVNLNMRNNGLQLKDFLSKEDNSFDLDKVISKFEESGKDKRDLFFVIDGQHRLRAFQFSDVPVFTVIVTAYVDLHIADVANTFVQINYNQKPVDKSIVYDLLGINEDIFPEFAKYHELVKNLNNDISSPFFGQIKMLGIGPGLISQASFITAIDKYRVEKRLKNIGITFTEDELYSVIKMYFNSVKSVYKAEWINKDTLLTKSIGLRTLIKFLPDFLEAIVELEWDISEESFVSMFNSLDEAIMATIDDDSQSIWEYFSTLGIGGEGGISNLHKFFIEVLLEVKDNE